MRHGIHQYFLLISCLTYKTLIENLFQMKQSPSWQIRTLTYIFNIYQFHLFDTFGCLTLIDEQMKSCTDKISSLICRNNILKIYLYTHDILFLFLIIPIMKRNHRFSYRILISYWNYWMPCII